jgi:probable rRNA maturation factor
VGGNLSGLPAGEGRIRAAAARALDDLGVDGAEMSVVIGDDDLLRSLNARWRGKDEATDVLSFSQEEGALPPRADAMPRHLGDIAISRDSMRENAARFGADEEEELLRLVVHGTLHLLGHDHATNDPDEPMLALQERLLGRRGATDTEEPIR